MPRKSLRTKVLEGIERIREGGWACATFKAVNNDGTFSYCLLGAVYDTHGLSLQQLRSPEFKRLTAAVHKAALDAEIPGVYKDGLVPYFRELYSDDWDHEEFEIVKLNDSLLQNTDQAIEILKRTADYL